MLNKTTQKIIKEVVKRSPLRILEQCAVIGDKLIATDLDMRFEVYVCGVKQGLYRGDMLKKTGDFVPFNEDIDSYPENSMSQTGIDRSEPLPFQPLLKYDFSFFSGINSRRHKLDSVCFGKSGDVVSTDGNKLINILGAGPEQKWETIVPSKAIKALKLMKEYGAVEMYSFRKGESGPGQYLVATAGPASLTIKLYDNEYPNYKECIPTTGKYIRFERFETFMKALKEIEPYANQRTGQIILDGSTVTAIDKDRGIEKTIDVGVVVYPGMLIGFNVTLLLGVLEEMKGSAEYVPDKNPISAKLFRSASNEIFVIMPIQIIDNVPEKEAEIVKPEDGTGNTEDPEPTPPVDMPPDTGLPKEEEREPEPPVYPADTSKTEEVIVKVAENIQVEEFPNPPAPPVATDKPATFKQIKYLVWLTGKPWGDLRGLARKQASAMITELTGK